MSAPRSPGPQRPPPRTYGRRSTASRRPRGGQLVLASSELEPPPLACCLPAPSDPIPPPPGPLPACDTNDRPRPNGRVSDRRSPGRSAAAQRFAELQRRCVEPRRTSPQALVALRRLPGSRRPARPPVDHGPGRATPICAAALWPPAPPAPSPAGAAGGRESLVNVYVRNSLVNVYVF